MIKPPPSFPRASRCAPAALAIAVMLSALPAQALRSDREQPINIDADTSEVDAKTGYTKISGSVVITQGSLVVHADEARVFVMDGRVDRVELDGTPATWEQRLDNGEDMNARANRIDYDVPAGVIELTGNAQVDHPQGEITGASLRYDLDSEKLRGVSQGNDRVRIRIEPDAVESGGILEGVGGRDGGESGTPAPAANDANNTTKEPEDNAGSQSPRSGGD